MEISQNCVAFLEYTYEIYQKVKSSWEVSVQMYKVYAELFSFKKYLGYYGCHDIEMALFSNEEMPLSFPIWTGFFIMVKEFQAIKQG